jgi:hypothetical protein
VFLFFSHSLVKRYVELADSIAAGTREPLATRGRGYWACNLETLSQLGISSGLIAVLVLALYIESPAVKQLYGRPEIISLLCPLVLYLIARSWILARRREMQEDPVLFALRDRRSQLVAGACLALLVLAALL